MCHHISVSNKHNIKRYIDNTMYLLDRVQESNFLGVENQKSQNGRISAEVKCSIIDSFSRN